MAKTHASGGSANEGKHSGGHMGPNGKKPPQGMAHHTSSGDRPVHPSTLESAHVKAHAAPMKHQSEYHKPPPASPAMPLGSGGKQGGGMVSDPDGDAGND